MLTSCVSGILYRHERRHVFSIHSDRLWRTPWGVVPTIGVGPSTIPSVPMGVEPQFYWFTDPPVLANDMLVSRARRTTHEEIRLSLSV